MTKKVGVTWKVHSLREEKDDFNNSRDSSLLVGFVCLCVLAILVFLRLTLRKKSQEAWAVSQALEICIWLSVLPNAASTSSSFEDIVLSSVVHCRGSNLNVSSILWKFVIFLRVKDISKIYWLMLHRHGDKMPHLGGKKWSYSNFFILWFQTFKSNILIVKNA